MNLMFIIFRSSSCFSMLIILKIVIVNYLQIV